MKFDIRLKLIGFTFCVVLLVGGAISLYSIYQGRQQILTTSEKDGREITNIISTTVTDALYFLNLSALGVQLNNARVNRNIRSTYVMGLNGLVLADGTEENALLGQKLTDTFSEEVLLSDRWISRVEGGILRVGGPILMADGSRIGYLNVGFALDVAYENVRNATRTSLYITLICLGIGAILAVILSTSFTRPVLSIVRASREIGEGKLDTRLSINRDDELGMLAESINQMAVNLKNDMERIQNQAVELEKANKTKNEFLSVMSHELRTPLNVVMGYTGMIKDGMLGEINPEQERALEKVTGRSSDLLGMISQILEATSLEANAVKVEIHEFNLGRFLDDLRSSYEVSINKELSFKWDYPKKLPVVIKTDSQKLRHILQNLINNAVKFTESGYVNISARVATWGQSSGVSADPQRQNPVPQWVEFKVADRGIGIPRELLPTIFEMFRQVDSSETRLYGGVGIGLYIVKKYADLLGGKIEVESESGKGSTFTITIPC